ncbi:hypothetical protein JXQ70_11230 [bacterium]|nr:hypothetical protein [bacterium]
MQNCRKCRVVFIVVLVLFVALTQSLWSCSDDDDDDNTPTPTPTATPTPIIPTALRLTQDAATEQFIRTLPGTDTILFDQPRDDTHYAIYSVSLNGSCSKTLITSGPNTYHEPDVNPTGTHLCYATGVDDAAVWEIGLYEIGASETILTNNQSLGLDSHHPVFKSDGSQIAYYRRNWADKYDTLVVMDMTGSHETEICTLDSGATNYIEALDWLNGTNLLIFTSKSGKLFRVEAAAGATPSRIDDHVGYHTCFSYPDGSAILCAQSYGTGQQYIEIKPDGTGKRVLVDPAEFPMLGAIYCQICWLPDRSGLIALAQDTTLTDFDVFLLKNFD